MKTKPPLSDYIIKRDFKKTPEPKRSGIKREKDIFVIQEHDATHLHYDLRLKIGNVLKSWAIPEKPTGNQEEKRLAINTEDHPLSYANFKGTIPKGNYGAGTVKIWDKGTFENLRTISLKKSYHETIIPS